MARHRRSPRPLGDALASLQRSASPQTLLAEIQAAWDTAVGPRTAAACRPLVTRADTLTVQCRDATWAQELSLMSELILAALNPYLASGRITRLHCVSAGQEDA